MEIYHCFRAPAQSVSFSVPCSMCGQQLLHTVLRKPTRWSIARIELIDMNNSVCRVIAITVCSDKTCYLLSDQCTQHGSSSCTWWFLVASQEEPLADRCTSGNKSHCNHRKRYRTGGIHNFRDWYYHLYSSYSKLTPWSESESELYRQSDRRLSAKLVPTFEDRGCHVVSLPDPYGSIIGFLHRSRYFFFEVAPQLYSRGWVDPVPDSLLLRKSGSAENRTRTSRSVSRNSDH
jgi:hypothetical protein